jgi:serine/threonine protein kinase
MDRPTFLAHLRRSGLVGPSELAALLPKLSACGGARLAARVLVEGGVLTRFQAGRLLAGRSTGFFQGPYRILAELGRGGMGRVFKAEHRLMGRPVALKMLAPDVLKTDRARDLFLREVRALARLLHPNIVAAFDANESAGCYYIVLEFVDGPNLDQLVRSNGPLPVGYACECVRQVARGLQHAHALGMVHRDIKPANLLVQRSTVDGTPQGETVKISDFGLARPHGPGSDADTDGVGTLLAAANSVVGTPDYVSPEQSRCLHEADQRSDLYSLGCTFYYLLTARVPFPGGGTVDKLIRHHTEPPPLVTEVRPEVASSVTAIVAKLMAKVPADRFQTAGELADALAPFCASGHFRWTNPATVTVAAADTLTSLRTGTDDAHPVFQSDSSPHTVVALASQPAATNANASPLLRSPSAVARALGLVRRAFGK